MSQLKLFLLGRPSIELDGEPLRLKNRRAMALLAYLAANPQSHSRDSLINLLWPDYDSSRGRTLLRTTLYTLNKALESEWVKADRDNLALNPDSDLWIDVNKFHNLLAQCRSHGHSSSEVCPDCLDPLNDAVDLYGGDFLTGFSLKDSVNFDDWQVSQTQSLHSDMVGALERLVSYLIEQEEFEKAITYSQRWLELDRINEEVHRKLMEVYARLGRRPAALKQYDECVKVLKEKLGVSPQESTIQLYEAIKDNADFIRSIQVSESPTHKPQDTPPNNLPAPLTSFIGRGDEVESLDKLLRDGMRLVTLTGPGGTGKTRLGLKVAGDLIDHFDDGVFLVSLAPISDPDLVPSAIAHTLGVQETGDQPILESLKNYLEDKMRLILLDNFEHVVTAAPTVTDLLTSCPRLKILATSREILHLQGEHEFQVSPLTLPDLENLPEVESLSQYEAVELFIQRAVALKSDFSLTNQNAPAVAEICHCLDGLPLAIELAASRIKILTPKAILERLSSRMKLLTGGSRDLPERQQTIRSAIAWSHDLLEEEEKVLFRRMSVFVGGSTLETVEAVCDPERNSQLNVLDGVASLVDKSLLRKEASPKEEVASHKWKGDKPRFLMLETVREYGLERLAESGEEEAIKQHHLSFFLALVEEAEPELHGPDQVEWIDRLELEHDNLRAALEWSISGGDSEAGLRLAGSLWWFWYVHGYLSEGCNWLERVLSGRGGTSDLVQARTLYKAGGLVSNKGDFERAQELSEESLALARKIGDKRSKGYSLGILAVVKLRQGDYGRAVELCKEGLDLHREVGDKWGTATYLSILGQLALGQGNYKQAMALCNESLALFRAIGDRWGIAYSLLILGNVELDQGDYEQALLLYRESLALYQKMGVKRDIAKCLERFAEVAGAKGQLKQAARLYGAAEALREAIGSPIPPSSRDDYDRSVTAVRAELGEEAIETAWAEGRAMSMEQAISYALEEGDNV